MPKPRKKKSPKTDEVSKLNPPELPAIEPPHDPTPSQQLLERLRYNLDIYLNPGQRFSKRGQVLKLNGLEIKEIRDMGMIPRMPGDKDEDDGNDIIAGGQEGVAAAIRHEFKTSCHVAYVSDWLKGKRFPCPDAPPMPGPESSGRFSKAKIFEWYRQYVFRDAGRPGANEMVDNRARKEKADADTAEMVAEATRRTISNQYVEMDIVRGLFSGFGHWLGIRQDSIIEDDGGVLKIFTEAIADVFNPSPEQSSVVKERIRPALAAANSAMKSTSANHSKELLKQLIKDREARISDHIKKQSGVK